ncbi:MAG: hypothetical protein NZL99_07895 [Burkholderiaceae bacterium]|nr:hypothetical protein [Burkholderiaceae bacterium]MCX8004422.1 hypothetical protein [Burkholderiaceae bacterium]
MSGKSLLVLARRDHTEAMRVAAGLTLVGNAVTIVFMDRPVAETAQNVAHYELLQDCSVAAATTVPALAEQLPLLDAPALARAIAQAAGVICV